MKRNFLLRIIHGVSLRSKILYERILTFVKILRSRKSPVIYLFGSPRHSNMGDQAQTYCIVQWVHKNYPDYGMIIFNMYISNDILLRLIRKCIKKSDLIFFHSGYHLTDLYREKEVYCKVLRLFPEFRILVFPQTVNFVKDRQDEERVANIFNKHGNVVLCCRDEVSYGKAEILFHACKLLLYPDIVTSLIGRKKSEYKRNGILFCLRNDIEAYYKPEQIEDLMARFKGVYCKRTDTTLAKLSPSYITKHREKILGEMFEEYAHYKVVITDRYHGTIFSLIAATPVVVLSSTDHKLSSGVRWFPESFSKYVFYARDLDEAYKKACELLKDNTLEYSLPPYFEENYYSKLKGLYESL